jgi:AraC family transcriptional regulator of arabinose operon
LGNIFIMNTIQSVIPLSLTGNRLLDTLVEHRKVYNLQHCEVNIFETYSPCGSLDLSYNGLVISSMLRGKKTVGLPNETRFDFMPGETLILPEGTKFNVDFPGVDKRHPVQCATLVLDWGKVKSTLDFLNYTYPADNENDLWDLNFTQYHFNQNQELTGLINKLIHISMEDSLTRDALADCTLTELLIRIIQTQKLQLVDNHQIGDGRFVHVMQYIRSHLSEHINVHTLSQQACMSKSNFFRIFKDTFGLSPVDFIIRERIELAKKLLKRPATTISEVCLRSGFNNLNYFIRLFKRLEGVTPGSYLKRLNE